MMGPYFVKKFLHYLNVYKGLIIHRFGEVASFRLNFVLVNLMDIVFYAIALLTMEFIYQKVGMIGPWNKSQFLFFISFMLCIDNLNMAFMSENFWGLSTLLRTGDLDYILLRPLSPIFNIFFKSVRISCLMNFPLVFGALIYYGLLLHLSVFQWVLVLPLIFLGFYTYILIGGILSCSMFWLVDGMAINFVRMQLKNISRYPDYIYSSFFKKIFTFVVPVLVIGAIPVRAIFEKNPWPLFVLTLFIAFLLTIIFYVIFQQSLKVYNSASS